MKKAVVIFVSVLFYISAFMLFIIIMQTRHLYWFIFGFPLTVALYFVIVGNIFSHRLNLNHWHLWLGMNFIGYPCSWIVLLACFPSLLFNGGILFFMVPVTVVFAVVWAVIGIGFLCVRRFKRHSGSADSTEKLASTSSKRRGAWIERAMTIVHVAGVILLVLAISSLYLGFRELSSIRSISDYEDKGVHTFSPYQVLPVQVENTATGRAKRLYPTKTVYVVYYRAMDGTGYKWKLEASGGKSTANRILAEREDVERRVLSIKETGNYITIETEQTADIYVTGRKQRGVLIIGLSVGYLVFYLGAWVVVVRKQKKKIET